jgi:hypothetical protein
VNLSNLIFSNPPSTRRSGEADHYFVLELNDSAM